MSICHHTTTFVAASRRLCAGLSLHPKGCCPSSLYTFLINRLGSGLAVKPSPNLNSFRQMVSHLLGTKHFTLSGSSIRSAYSHESMVTILVYVRLGSLVQDRFRSCMLPCRPDHITIPMGCSALRAAWPYSDNRMIVAPSPCGAWLRITCVRLPLSSQSYSRQLTLPGR